MKINPSSPDTALSLLQREEMQRAARALSNEQRQQIIMALREVQLHPHLKELFQAIDPDYLVEVTHGSVELGKDLVLVKRNALTTDVIGVVVKCGDITGKTLGEVDELKEQVEAVQKLSSASAKTVREIESQIQQATEHPAELHSILQKLPVNKIMVVLAGKLSGNARVRIEGELKLGGNVRDIQWLVDHFTEHYPQVFFEGQSVDFLQKEIQRLETSDWLVKSDKNLSEWWVEPLVSTVDMPLNFDAESLEALWQQEKFPFAGLAKVLKEGRHVILAGDPGSGKSVAMAKFALTMLRAAYERATHRHGENGEERQPLEVPVLVTARELWEAKDAHELKAKYFHAPEVAGQFHIRVLLVDGLDELSAPLRQQTIEKARDFADDLKCSLVITSRKIEILRETPKGFRKYELMPFEMGQALRLFEKLMAGNPLLSALQDGLKKIQGQIPLTPLSLVLLMEVVTEHNEVPSSITELYNRFFDMLLGRYEAKKGIEVLFEPLIKRRFLAGLAYHEFFHKDRLEIPQADFENFCQSFAQEFGYDKERLEEFTTEIDRAGVLVMREMIEFKHRSFLDYFVASWIFDNADEIDNLNTFLVEVYFGDLWSDVTFFYIGLKAKISQPLLEQIFNYPKDTLGGHADKLLAGKLLQAGWNSSVQIKAFGVQGAFRSAPEIQLKLAAIADKTGGRVPRIIADYIVMIMAETALRSGHLSLQLKELLHQLLNAETELDVRMLPAVLWTVQPLLNETELGAAVDATLKVIARPGVLTPEEAAAALILMRNLQTPDKSLLKSIERQMNRLQDKHPEAFQAILPVSRKGFRPRKPPKKPSE